MNANSDGLWVRSSYSAPNGGTCVEWAPAVASAFGVVPVRDSKVFGGPVLLVSAGSWAGLVALVCEPGV
ncbi:DUF397 domain-containing protein [Streptomyces sp. NPDC049906]|uniref:DUF397 domain-containing protein n=1 Tax=Streptomyces sp. NPDC049906 TaxID=3155656 RepID=UPI0034183590